MRREVKYLIPEEARDGLAALVSRYTVRDPHASDGGAYTVRSVYLDTARGAMYDLKREGISERVKVRVRGYGDVGPNSPVVLELKRKSGAIGWKSRAHCTLEAAVDWLQRGPTGLPFSDADKAAAMSFRYFTLSHGLKPVVLVAYEREPFLGRHDPTLRVTFDRGLRGRFASRIERLGSAAPVGVFSNHFILEVKFDYHFPTWLKPALADLGAQRRALSKYVLTMDACARATHGRRAPFSGGRVLRRGLPQTSF